MKLTTKFIAAVLGVLVTVLALTAWLLIRHQRDAVHTDALERAQTVLSFGEACRDYARDVLDPVVRKHTNRMVFEAQSATFVARGTFEKFTKRQPGYTFREAALNPLNPSNRADPEEERIIRRFQQERDLPEQSGFRNDGKGDIFYVARPIVVKKVCLQCHDTPELAPPELVAEYPSGGGFGWKEGDLTSAILVTVPAADIHAEQMAVLREVLAVFAVLAVLLALVLYFVFDRLVKRRLATTAAVMERVAAEPTAAARLDDPSPDEIGHMTAAFNRMADSLRLLHTSLENRVAERTAALEKANAALHSEVALRQQTEEELHRSNAELEQFAYVASHDMQEPLRMVASYVQLLADRYKDQLDERAERWIGFAEGATAHMRQLINDLLALSRIGRQSRTFETADAAELCRTAVANLEQAIRESGAAVRCEALPKVRVDPTQFVQLLQNLIGNAIKYRGPRPPEVTVRAERRGREWLFSVADNGIGIAPEHRERIFVIFQRLHTREEYAGTGIGLAVCKKIAERHGGRIWVESTPGQGSTFFFTIPAQD